MFTDKKEPLIRQIGAYFFVANGRTTGSALAVENVAFDLTSPYAYYCKVQLNYRAQSAGDDDATLASFQELASDFMTSLLPEIAQILPDWRDYESVDGQVVADEVSDQGSTPSPTNE